VGGVVGVMLDISERKRMEDDLRQAATVFDNSAEGVIIATGEGSIIAVNRAFTEITGYAREEVIGRNPRMFQSGRHDAHFYRTMWGAIHQFGRWQGEVWNRRKNGDVFPQWIYFGRARFTDRLTNYVATFSRHHLPEAERRAIQLLAFSDPLTGLPIADFC
jgi:PAS domain S-box-containing protein